MHQGGGKDGLRAVQCQQMGRSGLFANGNSINDLNY